jgi:hypothetical protein
MRVAKHLPDNYLSEIANLIDTVLKIDFYVDEEYEDDLFNLLDENEVLKKKFKRVIYLVRIGKTTQDTYRSVAFSRRTKDVYEMKVKNYRFLCKEIRRSGEKRIVTITHIQKDTKKMRTTTRALVTRIGGYDYEFEK